MYLCLVEQRKRERETFNASDNPIRQVHYTKKKKSRHTSSVRTELLIKMILLRLFALISLTHAIYLYFEYPSYEISVFESTEISTKLTRISAISSPQLSIRYALHTDTNQTFALHAITGELILLKPLDYENIGIYQLTIEARSLSSIIIPCFTELIIHVMNINDHPPEIHLIIHPSIFYETYWIALDRNTLSTSFATIHIKDIDPSTSNLSLTINDTEHFQIQSIRQTKSHLLYLLSTKDNIQFLLHSHYNLLLTSCDNDQPSLCTNRTYQFHFQSFDYLCNLSFEQKTYLIDIEENLPRRSLVMNRIPNQFCLNPSYSMDDRENFHLDLSTGDLFTSKIFNRTERSIYSLHLIINNTWRIEILVRILDENGNLPFLIQKIFRLSSHRFSSLHIFNSNSCRAQSFMENYFQFFSNCTLVSLIPSPPQGRYFFHIHLDEQSNFHDTFLLELNEDDESPSRRTWRQSLWIKILIALLGIFFVLISLILIRIMIIKQLSSTQFDQRTSPLSIDDDSQYHKYEPFTPMGKLKVHDDHQLSSSARTTAIYLVGKSSPGVSSSTPARDDEGYSGSSDTSDRHLPYEITIISANDLLEQYRIDHYPTSLYDVPRRSIDKINTLPIVSDMSLV